MSSLILKMASRKDSSDILYFIRQLAKFEKLENQVKTNIEELRKNY